MTENSNKTLDLRKHVIVGHKIEEPVAVISIDIEKDYTGTGQDALDLLPEVLIFLRKLDVPLTAFVEGQLFRERADLCDKMLETGTDMQLHCFDHTKDGDDREDIERSIEAYKSVTGHAPSGYRAHTYRLNEEILETLYQQNFSWDSSLLPGWGLGAIKHDSLRSDDYYVLDGKIFEFPLASWRRSGIPFVHSYRRLMTPLIEYPLRVASALPDLLIYDMHMVDLVRNGKQWAAPLPLWLKLLYTLTWAPWERNSMSNLADLLQWLKGRGYRFQTMSELYKNVSSASV